jgi:hypothetical protein
MSETMQGRLASGSLFTDLIKEISDLHYSDFSEPSQFQKMIVTAHDIVGTSGGTLPLFSLLAARLGNESGDIILSVPEVFGTLATRLDESLP